VGSTPHLALLGTLGVLVLDALVFFVPVVAVALVLGALFAPSWLRVMARFLEALAAAER